MQRFENTVTIQRPAEEVHLGALRLILEGGLPA